MNIELQDSIRSTSTDLSQEISILRQVTNERFDSLKETLTAVAKQLTQKALARNPHHELAFSNHYSHIATTQTTQDPTEIYYQQDASLHSFIAEGCDSGCSCQYHHYRPQCRVSPTWLDSFIGRLFVTYSAIPMLDPRPCTGIGCKLKRKNHLSSSYYFPKWIVSRAVFFTTSWNCFIGSGTTLHLRVPRVNEDPHVWRSIECGDIKGLQKLFSLQKALPTDIRSSEASLILVSSLHSSAKLMSTYAFTVYPLGKTMGDSGLFG